MKNNKGFIKAIIILLIAIVILGIVFDISIVDILKNNKVQESLAWIWKWLGIIWSYISAPIMWFWNKFVIGIVWNAIQAGLN